MGSMIMLLPALGESGVPQRIRLVLALSISFLMYVLVRAQVPTIPDSPYMIAILIFSEILIGIMIGTSIRLLLSAVHTAGTIIAMQSGLAMAQAFDPVQGAQSAIMGTFMTLMAVTLIFVTNLHHLMIGAMHDSYTLFPIGGEFMIADFSELIVDTVARSFLLGVQMASPLIVYGLVFNMGLGILARLMPQLQVFFIAMPLNIMMGFIILGAVISGTMVWFLEHMELNLQKFLL